MDLSAVRLLILDVDGVLTDGTLTLDATREVTKTFHTRDGAAIKLWQSVGGTIALLSGRQSAIVKERAASLGIEAVRLGEDPKLPAYEAILAATGHEDRQTAYMGDDWPDLPPMQRCAFAIAPANASPVVKRTVHCVTRRAGGTGAVAEAVELILRKQQRWPRTHPTGPQK